MRYRLVTEIGKEDMRLHSVPAFDTKLFKANPRIIWLKNQTKQGKDTLQAAGSQTQDGHVSSRTHAQRRRILILRLNLSASFELKRHPVFPHQLLQNASKSVVPNMASNFSVN